MFWTLTLENAPTWESCVRRGKLLTFVPTRMGIGTTTYCRSINARWFGGKQRLERAGQIKEKLAMAEFFIERRDDEGDYAIRRRGAKKASDVCDTQAEAV